MTRALALSTLLMLGPGQAPPPAAARIPGHPQAIVEFADALIAAAPDERARLLAERPDMVNSALRYFIASRASRLVMARQYRAAIPVFEVALEVARAAKDRRGESETLQNLANAHYFLREFDAAEPAFRERLALARDLNDRDAIAASTSGLATVWYSRADYSAALAAYRDALTIYQTMGNDAAVGSTLVSIGNVMYLQADYDAAASSYRRAIALLTAAMDVNTLAFARSGLARVFASQGDLASALDAYGHVLAEARARNQPGTISSALESIGELHYRLRNVDEARAAFEEAERLAERAGQPDDAGRLLASLGLTELVAGQFERALAAYTSSRARFEQANAAAGIASAWVGIGFSYGALEKFPEAIAAYKTAIAAFEALKRDEEAGRAWLGLSLAHSAAGDPPAALESAHRVRRIAAKVRSDDLQWRAAVREGEALRAVKRPGDARRAFDDAIEIVQRLAAEAPLSAELRATLPEAESAWKGLALALADRGNAAGAFAAEESRRAFLRRIALASAEHDIVRGMTPEEQRAEQQAARDLISARAQVRAERGMPKPDPVRLARLEQQRARLASARDTDQASLYARLPALRAWRGLDPPPALADIEPLLSDSRTLALEYAVSDDDILILALARGEAGIEIAARVVPFKRREFAASLAKALEPGALRDQAEWAARSAPLADVLIAPIAARLTDRDRLVIVPDDLLWKVPFEALAAGETDLASRASVTYATSFGTWTRQAAIAADDTSTLAAFAGPALAPSMRDRLALTLPGWAAPDASSATAEAASFVDLYAARARLLTGADATEAALRAAFDTAAVIHLAAPLHVAGASPVFSSVLLAGAESTPASDGRWEVREWFATEGRARLLVLTDAASLGAPGAGAAMDTLAWAAAAAGVRALILARWPGAGFDVLGPLSAVHDRLGRGAPVPLFDAWRDAVAAARSAGDGAPAGWAGLRLIGAP